MRAVAVNILAFAILVSFLGILFVSVPRLDLALVLGVTALMAFYDLFFHPRH